MLLHDDGLSQAGAGYPQGMQRDIPFIEIWNKFRTKACCAEAGDDCQKDRSDDRYRRKADRGIEGRAVGDGRAAHDGAFLFFDLSANKQRNGGWNEGQGKDQCGGQCEHDRESHRVKHLPFDAGEGEDRQIDDGDDDDAEDGRLDHFCRSFSSEVEPLFLRQHTPERMLGHAEPSEAIFYDDDCAIDDQAEVERAEAHQVSGYLVLDHSGDRHQHGQRDDKRREDGGPDVPEQQEQDHDDQECAFNKVLLDSRDGAIDEQGSVINGGQCHAIRQAGANGVDPCIDGLRDSPAVLADEHERGTKNNLFTVLRRRARAQLLAKFDRSNVSDAYRCGAGIRDDDLAEVVEGRRLSWYAHQILLAVALDISGACVRIVLLKGRHDIGKCEPERCER